MHHLYHLTLAAGPKSHSHQSCQQLEPGPCSTHAWWTEWDHTARRVRDAIKTQDRQWSSGAGFVQTQVQTHGLHKTGLSYTLFLSIPHLAAVQLPTSKHSLIYFVRSLKTPPQISKNFTFLFSLFLSHSNWKGPWLDKWSRYSLLRHTSTSTLPVWGRSHVLRPPEGIQAIYRPKSDSYALLLLYCFLRCFIWSLTTPPSILYYLFLPCCLGRRIASGKWRQHSQGQTGSLTYYQIKLCQLAGGANKFLFLWSHSKKQLPRKAKSTFILRTAFLIGEKKKNCCHTFEEVFRSTVPSIW